MALHWERLPISSKAHKSYRLKIKISTKKTKEYPTDNQRQDAFIPSGTFSWCAFDCGGWVLFDPPPKFTGNEWTQSQAAQISRHDKDEQTPDCGNFVMMFYMGDPFNSPVGATVTLNQVCISSHHEQSYWLDQRGLQLWRQYYWFIHLFNRSATIKSWVLSNTHVPSKGDVYSSATRIFSSEIVKPQHQVADWEH